MKTLKNTVFIPIKWVVLNDDTSLCHPEGHILVGEPYLNVELIPV